MPKAEIYPNSQLAEVVFEARFSGIPAIECQRHLLYEKVREAYPMVFVPQVKDGDFPALKAQRYANEDQSGAILHSINSFGYSSKVYPGFDSFKKELLRIFDIFRELFGIEKLNRIGWRYINLVPYAKADGVIPIEQFFKLGLTLPDSSSEYENLGIKLTAKLKRGHVNLVIEGMESKAKDGKEVLLFDIDYFKTEDLTAANIEDYINEGHKYSRQLFEDLITDNYRQYLKGKKI